ncbi:MAG: DUF1573 domain-containing protein [Bacteroidales bacterium]
MKKNIFLFLSISLGTLSMVAQEKQDSIKFDKTMHDFKTLSQGGDGTCQFTFVNEGDNPIILSNVRSSCGCTVPKWPRKPIQPGESGVIDVKYNTNRIGRFNKSITVSSNAVNSPVVLRIMGTVEAK